MFTILHFLSFYFVNSILSINIYSSQASLTEWSSQNNTKLIKTSHRLDSKEIFISTFPSILFFFLLLFMIPQSSDTGELLILMFAFWMRFSKIKIGISSRYDFLLPLFFLRHHRIMMMMMMVSVGWTIENQWN